MPDFGCGSGRSRWGCPRGISPGTRTSLQAGNTRLRVMDRFSLTWIHRLARSAWVVDLSMRPATCRAGVAGTASTSPGAHAIMQIAHVLPISNRHHGLEYVGVYSQNHRFSASMQLLHALSFCMGHLHLHIYPSEMKVAGGGGGGGGSKLFRALKEGLHACNAAICRSSGGKSARAAHICCTEDFN